MPGEGGGGLTPARARDILGLAEPAGPAEVEAAYRRLLARTDPARWAGADPVDRDAAAARRAEVQAAYGVLGGDAGADAARPGPAPPAGERVGRTPFALPPATAVDPDDVVVEGEIVEDAAGPAPGGPAGGDGRRPGAGQGQPPPDAGQGRPAPPRPAAGAGDGQLPKGLKVLFGAVAAVVAVLVTVGLLTPARGGGREREALGPMAHRYWEAERRGDYGVMWDLSEDSLRRSISRADFVEHLAACPKRLPPREVYRIVKRPDGLWEVEARSRGSYLPTGRLVFREEEGGRFGNVVVDTDLLVFLDTPLPDAIAASSYCRRG